MATIKKAYLAIASLLAANPDALCSEIYPQFEALASAKTSGGGGGVTSFHKDDEGNVLVARCAYHDKYFHTADVKFGKKASSASGLNTMCKDGTSKWTKQLATFKKAKEQLLDDVGSGEIEASDIVSLTEEYQTARDVIVPIEDIAGYDTLEEAIEAL